MPVRRRDALAVATSLPAAVVMVVCLFVPYARDCSGHAGTAFDAGAAPWMIGVALLGMLPAAWRWAPVRRVAPVATTFVAVVILAQTVIGIPIALYLCLGYTGRWLRGEVLTAISSLVCVIVFVIGLPILTVMIDSQWLIGGYLSWAAAGAEVYGLAQWWSAARARRVESTDRELTASAFE